MEEEKLVWYFAIGSMMNNFALNYRGIFPVESKPAEILDFEITFFSKLGMACADPKQGTSFHGVLHKVSEKQMEILDKIEGIYTRIPSKAKTYDGEIINCTIYSDPVGKIDHSNDRPPTERYIDIMVEGATKHGVKKEYVDWLRNIEQQPRKKMHEFNVFALPENAPTMTFEEVQKGDGEDGRPVLTAVNGKVLEVKAHSDDPMHNETLKWCKENLAGKHAETTMCFMLYDPKFGAHEKIEDIHPEQTCSIEDTLFAIDVMRAIAKLGR